MNVKIRLAVSATAAFVSAALFAGSSTAVPDEVQAAMESSYFPKGKDALVWGGGTIGVWDDGTLNWFTEDGVSTAWKAGAIAVFPNSATITVVGEKSVAKVLNVAAAERVVFTGDPLTFTTGEVVRFGANGIFRFENALGGSEGYSQAIGESDDAVLKLESPVYMVSTEARKILPAAAKLATIESFSFALDTCWGGKRTRRVNNDVVENKEGIYNWTYDPETDSATFLLKALTTEGYNTIITAVKVKLQQEADGIYASVIYVKDALGNAAYGCLVHGEKTTWDCDFDAYEFRRDNGCDLCDENVQIKNYWVALYDFECSLQGAIPTEMSVEIAGDCTISGGGGYTLEAGAFRVVDTGTLGGGTLDEDVTVSPGALFELAGTAAIEVKGKLTNLDSDRISGRILISGEGIKLTANKGHDWELNVSGRATASGYDTLPSGGAGTKVLTGGELSIGATLDAWGPAGAGGDIHVEKGGTLKLTTSSSMGIAKPTRVEGGTLVNAYDGWGNILYKVHLSNGAHLTGYKMEAGNNDYYQGSDTAQYSGSFLWQMGTEKSLVDFEEIRLGASTDATANPIQLKFICDGPLEVASPLTAKAADVIRVNSPEMFGFLKKGADTLTLSSDKTVAPNAALILQAGTVSFPSAAKAIFGALVVTGDSTLDIADGGCIAFEDSSSVAWTSDATLTIRGQAKSRSIRVGTSATALTSAQLAQIRYESAGGVQKPVTIDANGYLRFNSGFRLIVR